MHIRGSSLWIYLALHENVPPKEFLISTIKRYDIKVYTLVIHKYGKFHYIIYKIDKITLLLFMAS